MNKKRVIVMLTILLITILSASSFYMIDKGIDPLSIFVNSYAAEPSSNDFEKVYGDKNAPYTETSGEHKDEKYFIRYTGKQTKSTVVDLTKSNQSITIGEDGYPIILGTRITNTYKMFSKSSSLETYADVERVFIPDSVAITDDSELGIQSNTFVGCKQEIDCIYETGEIVNKDTRGSVVTSDYDKTNNIKQDNVTTYVCLDSNNIANRSEIQYELLASNTYLGQIKNVYVNKDVANIPYFFNKGSSNEINNILLDKDGTWVDLTALVSGQDKITKISSHFQIPDSVTSVYNMFRSTSIKRIPDGFEIPESVTSMFDMFARCYSLEYIPDSFVLPKGLKNARGIFFMCTSLKDFPSEFVIPESVTDMQAIFQGDSYLSTTVIVKSKTAILKDGYSAFAGAGTADGLDNLPNYNTPIVMKCYSDSVAATYTDNIYGEVENGKVTKEVIDGEWAKVYDKDAPYGDTVKYYIHYVGNSSDKKNSVTVDLSDTSKYKLDTKGYPIIMGTSITNTYKMFSNNDKVMQVIIPDSIAIKAEKDTTLSTGCKGIQSNTFDGCEQEIDCIYKTGEIANKDVRGSVITSDYDRTGIISNSKVTTYVCLDSDNIANRSGIQQYESLSSNTYLGQIKNVYINKDVANIAFFFCKGTSNEINNILLDKDGTWTDLTSLINNQGKLERISSHFQIPSSVTSVHDLFRSTSIEKIPDGFKIPNGMIDMQDMFARCYSLEYIPDSFVLPNGVQNARGIFYMCTGLKEFPSKFEIPESVTDMQAMFQYDYNLSTTVIVKSKTATLKVDFSAFAGAGTAEGLDNLPNYNTPIVMKCYSDSVAESYTDNIYGEVDNGKVTKEVIDGEWAKVYDKDAPYGDNVKYYVHYVGNSNDKKNSVTIDLSDTSKYKLDTKGYPIIMGTSITNTYKMFSGNDKVMQVIIPDSIAIKAHKDTTISTGCKGIQSNTFDGCEQEIDCIYKTGEIANKDMRGSEITSDYDRTGIISNNKVTTYVCLDSDNIADRSKIKYVELANNTYLGQIKNVYINKDVANIHYFFSKGSSNEINNILLDKDGAWTDLTALTSGQDKITKISSHFQIPESVIYTVNMFRSTSIKRIPDGFTVPKSAIGMTDMFARCYSLEYIPDGFVLPDNLENAQGIFFMCTSLKDFPSEFVIPEKVTTIQAIFQGDSYLSTTVIVKSKTAILKDSHSAFAGAGTAKGLANLPNYNTPIVMKCYSDSIAATYTDNIYGEVENGKVTKEYIDIVTNSLKETEKNKKVENNATLDSSNQGSSNVDNRLDETDDNELQVSNEKIMIEDETDYITVTVNKKTVDEVVDETLKTSENVESVESKQ